MIISDNELDRRGDLKEQLAMEKFDTTQLGLDKNRRAALLVSAKVDTPLKKGLHRQMVDNNTARDQLEELLLEAKPPCWTPTRLMPASSPLHRI